MEGWGAQDLEVVGPLRADQGLGGFQDMLYEQLDEGWKRGPPDLRC